MCFKCLSSFHLSLKTIVTVVDTVIFNLQMRKLSLNEGEYIEN